MKTTVALLLTLSLHILATSAHRSTPNLIRLPTDDGAAAASADSPMLDTDGDVLKNNLEYYMLPFITPGTAEGGGGGGSGVKLARLDPADECPNDAIQTPDTSDPGSAVVFLSAGSTNETVIDPSVYQSVSFDDWRACISHSSWKIKYDDGSKQHFVKVGPPEDDPNKNYVFKVQRFRPDINAYKIVYCPGEDICYNVGRFYDEESKNIRLALRDDPFVVVFKKCIMCIIMHG